MIFIGGTNLASEQMPVSNIIEYQIESEIQKVNMFSKLFKNPKYEKIFISEEFKTLVTIKDEEVAKKIEYFRNDNDLLRRVNKHVGVFTVDEEELPVSIDDVGETESKDSQLSKEQQSEIDNIFGQFETVEVDAFDGVGAIDADDYDVKEAERRRIEAEEAEFKKIMEAQQKLLASKKETAQEETKETETEEAASEEVEEETEEPKTELEVQPEVQQEEIEEITQEEEIPQPQEEFGINLDESLLQANIEDTKTKELKEEINKQKVEIEELKILLKQKDDEISNVRDKNREDIKNQAEEYSTNIKEKEQKIRDLENGFHRFKKYSDNIRKLVTERVGVQTNSKFYTLVANGFTENTEMVESFMTHITSNNKAVMVVDFSGYSSLSAWSSKHKVRIDNKYTSLDLQKDIPIQNMVTTVGNSEVIKTSEFHNLTLLGLDWNMIITKLDEYASGVPVVLLLGDGHDFVSQYVSNLLSKLGKTAYYTNTKPMSIFQASKDIGYYNSEKTDLICAKYDSSLKNVLKALQEKYRTHPFGAEVNWSEVLEI